VRARGIARMPLLPNRIGGLNVDEFFAVPDSAQGQMRVEPDISFRQLLEWPLGKQQPILALLLAARGPLHRDPGSAPERAGRHRVGELRLAVDVVDLELDAMQLAAGFDQSDTDSLVVDRLAEVALAIE